MASLLGTVVATLEARRATEMASLISRHGGVPYSAPALKESPLGNQEEVAHFVERLIQEPVDILVCLTGVGTRALLEAAQALGRLEAVLSALGRMTVVARGPKPVRVLKEYGIRIDLVPPEPNTSHELLEMLRPLGLRGKLIAMQHYGEPNVFLRDALSELGAAVLEVSLYRWERPTDQQPLWQLMEDVQRGAIGVVAATSKSQVHNLFGLARERGLDAALREALNQDVVVAAVGPVTAQAWREWGVTVDVMPEHPHMGHLVMAIAEHLEQRAARTVTTEAR